MGGEDDPMEGRSGNPVPPQYGETAPYYRFAATLCLPAALVAITMIVAPVPIAWCRAVAQLGAAYAFGSNVWLFRYGSRMFKVCKEQSKWLGKEAFSTIQAACFPEFFALQVSGCMLALGGHFSTSGVDLATGSIAAAVALGLVNMLVVGPMSIPLMMNLYSNTSLGGNGSDALLPMKQARKKFGIVHGISMLLDLIALVFTASYIVLNASAA